MTEIQPYLVLAYYYLAPLAKPHEEVQIHKDFFNGRDVTCRIYISEQGINGQMCAAVADAHAYMEWMQSREEYPNITFKISPYHEQVFPRITVKYRKNLVGFDKEIDFSKSGRHVDPQKWKEMLETIEDKILIDVRNDYEWKVGHFEGADLPPCETFREFDQYAEHLKSKIDPKKTPVMMYCTGGIRCELYSSILKDRGFENVYQLDGGIINYGLKQGSQHWLGKLFVFDDRLVVDVSEEKTKVIGKCELCGKEAETYYNCANMDCNKLFICCSDCVKEYQGCCQKECQCAKRVRPYHQDRMHKPFRRAHHYREAPEETKATKGNNCISP